MGSKVKEVLKEAFLILKEEGIERPRLESELLLSFFLKKDRLWLFKNDNFEVKKKDEFLKLVKKRALGYPLEYILGKVSFYLRDFFIEEGVLIPRPESEILIDKALKTIENIKNPKIAEIGVGSGVISIMLALFRKDSKITATDINKKALRLSFKNACLYGVEDRIDLIHTSFLDEVEGKFDLLVSNPPYISTSFKLDKNVLKEPKEALFGGERGDEIIEKIISLAVFRKIPYLVCEMGYDQREYVEAHLKRMKIENFYFYKDLAGLDRGFVARLSE